MTSSARPRDERGQFMKTEKMVVLPESEMEAINKQFGRLSTENFQMSEALQNVGMMLDVRGWSPLYQYGDDGGLSLAQLHSSSEQLRELVVGNPFIGRGAEVRNIYVLGAGVEFSAKTGKLTAATIKLIENARNQRYLFSADAMAELGKVAYTDGTVFALGDNLTKTFQRVPIKQITADLRNPDNPEEIWAYRRVWTRDPNVPNPIQMVRWYYTDIYDGDRAPNVFYNAKNEAVDLGKTMIDKGFNQQVGWAYGVPDALATIAWARLYKEFMVNGFIMSKALAQLAYKATVGSTAAGNNASIQVAKPQQSGATTVLGVGNDLQALPTAGKGYDFSSGSPLLAAVAAGVGVSEDILSAKGGVTLDAPSRATAAMRRQSWESFWVRVFAFMGNSKPLKVTWHDLPDEQIQRRLQALTLMWNTGLFGTDVIQSAMAAEGGIAEPGPIPDGVLLPNNKASLPRQDIDTDGQPVDPGSTGAGGSTAGTGQGQGGNGDTGGKGSGLGNDHSTD